MTPTILPIVASAVVMVVCPIVVFAYIKRARTKLSEAANENKELFINAVFEERAQIGRKLLNEGQK